MNSKILWSSSLIVVLTLLSACATPSIKEIKEKTDVTAIDSTQCASDFQELDVPSFAKLDYELKTKVKVNQKAACLLLNDKPTYLAAYVLPEFGEKGYGLQIESKLIKTQLVFIPDVYLLDSNLSVISKTTGDTFKYRQVKFEKTVFVNSNSKGPKYVVFTTDPEIVGESEQRRILSVDNSYVSVENVGSMNIFTGSDKSKEIFYTTQGEITVTPIKN